MGAVNTKTQKSDSGQDLLCCAECSRIEPSKPAFNISSDQKYNIWSESVQSRTRQANSHRQIIPQKRNLHHQCNDPLSESKVGQSRRRSSLSFAGNLPEGWTKELQERLEWAVEEIARRSKLRPPGHRAMQAVMAARSQGKRSSSAYGGRSPKRRPHLPARSAA